MQDREREDDFRTKVINDFLKYREFKQRCKRIEEADEIPSSVVNSEINRNAGIDYTKERVQSSNVYDPTSSPVLEAAEEFEECELEYKYKIRLVRRVERACKGLDPLEKLVMNIKYKTGRIVEDKQVYTHPNFPYGKTKYYEIKSEAIKKAARIIGYLPN